MNADILLSANSWHDLYAASGFDAGTPLLIYNKSVSRLLLWDGVSPPAGEDGVPVNPDAPIVVESGSLGCWVKSMGAIRVNVQEYV